MDLQSIITNQIKRDDNRESEIEGSGIIIVKLGHLTSNVGWINFLARLFFSGSIFLFPILFSICIS